MANENPKLKSSRKKKLAWTALIVLSVYTLFGFFLLPAIIKSQLIKQLPTMTHRSAEVREVKFNPFALSLTIRGLALKEKDGEPFSSFDELYVNFQPWASLFKRAWVFDEIHLYHPFAQVTYETNGEFNFANLISQEVTNNTSVKSSNAIPALVIRSLNISNGVVAFADLKRAVPFKTEFSPIAVSLTDLSTVRDHNSPYSFLARTGDKTTFAWSGSISLNPLGSTGSFKIGGLHLPKFSTYGSDFGRFEIANGALNMAADYRYDSFTNALDLSVTNFAVALSDFELKGADGKALLVGVPALLITNAFARLADNHFHIGLIKSSGGVLNAVKNHDGSIDLITLLNLPEASSAVAAVSNSVVGLPPLKADISEIDFSDYAVHLKDLKPAKSAAFDLDQISFNLKNVSNQPNAPVDFQSSLRAQSNGTVSVAGKAILLPLSADVKLGITNLPLKSIQPYLEQQVKLIITDGSLNVNGHARFSGFTNHPLAQFNGDVSINHFAAVDDVLFKDFVKWQALDIDQIQFELSPDQLNIGEVKVSGLDSSLIIGPDKRANLQTIFKLGTNAGPGTATAAKQSASTTNPPAQALFPLALGQLTLENNSFHFADKSIQPNCVFDIAELGGTIKHLSSALDQKADVDLHGKVDSHSPFTVKGKLDPFGTNLFVDIGVSFTNTDLTAFTPYTEKFAGRPLQKGKVSFAVHYLIEQKKLKAENGFYVDQLSLGARNNSPDATKLPVKLAIALLKDRRGRIQIDAPLSGRIDDPSFRVAPLIWRVVLNLMTKAATSPFSLLGSMFGGGEEMSFVNFAPGQTEIPAGETNKMQILAKALYERPELTVEINGSIDVEKDRPVLAQQAFERALKSQQAKDLVASGQTVTNRDALSLSPADHDRLVRELYETNFGKYQPPVANANPVVATTTLEIVQKAEPASTIVIPSPDHGATLLVTPYQPYRLTIPGKPARSIVKSNVPPASTAQVSSVTPDELADMEAQLLKKTKVTDEQLRAVMRNRAAQVQSYLLKTGKVTADRVYITAPKPLNDSFHGVDRADLSLD